MRQIRIAKSERVDRCPVCQFELDDIGVTRLNTVKGCIRHNVATCHRCNIRLTELRGQWRTSWLEVHQLDTEVDLELARDIYEIHEFNNQELAEEYGMTMYEFNQMAEDCWTDFLDKKRPKDKLFTWKVEGKHGLAVIRDRFVINLHQFDHY